MFPVTQNYLLNPKKATRSWSEDPAWLIFLPHQTLSIFRNRFILHPPDTLRPRVCLMYSLWLHRKLKFLFPSFYPKTLHFSPQTEFELPVLVKSKKCNTESQIFKIP